MADIFLSYADEDRLRAGTVVEALRDAGWSVWWSGDLAIGTAYRREIQEQLRAATCVVVLWSNASISSDWVIDEAEEGKTRDVLVQAIVDPVQPPHGFRGRQWADLTTWDGDPRGAGLQQILQAVSQFVPVSSERGPQLSTQESTSIPIAGLTERSRIRVVAWSAAIVAALVIAVVLFTMRPVGFPSLVASMSTSNPPSVDTGWIFVGYVNESQAFVEGPYANLAYRPTGAERGAIVPGIGDVLEVVKQRRVIIADYRSAGLSRQFQSPPLVHNPLQDGDDTGVRVEPRDLVIVRDVEVSGYPNRPKSVWVRIARCDNAIPNCTSARSEVQ